MNIRVRNTTENFNSYRAARVKSLFNAEDGSHFNLDAELNISDPDWRIGVIVGPSGSGKTSIGRQLWEGGAFWEPAWPHDQPIVDAIAPDGDFNAVTGALAAVGLGTVPAWLRPYPVLSNGEKFRADMARLVCEQPPRAIVDEFTSVVDRQIAKFGALAFAKSWRRTKGQAVLLTPHYDVLDWLEPDWIFDTGTGSFARGRLRQRPKFDLDIWQTNSSYWPAFKPHYYLDLPNPVAASYYVGTVDGGPIAAQEHALVRPGDTARSLWRRELQPLGVTLLRRTLEELDRGVMRRVPQDPDLATWEPSTDQPPLHRPDLPELGNGGWSGYTVVVDGLDARTPPAPTPDDDEYWIGAAGRLGGFAPRP